MQKVDVDLCHIIKTRMRSVEDMEEIKSLIEKGANVNRKDEDGWTPLHWAVHVNNYCRMKGLIESGADVNIENAAGISPWNLFFHNILYYQDYYLDRFFLQKLDRDRKERVLMLLITAGPIVNQKCDNYGRTSLHVAAALNSKKMAKFMMQQGIGVKREDNPGNTALHYAALHGSIEVAKLLIESEANVDAMNANGDTPLHYAALYGHTDVAKLLVENGANVNTENVGRNAPSHFIVVLRGFFVPEDDYNLADVFFFYLYSGNTPLHMAALCGDTEMVNFLVKNGANVNAKNLCSYTPLYCAKDERVAKLLIRHMFYFIEKPQFLFGVCLTESGAEARCSRCEEYWDKCNYQLNRSGLHGLLKVNDLDEQVKIWCEHKNLRDYCMQLEVLEAKYPDLVGAVTNVVDRIKKEIFLRNNQRWRKFINDNLSLAQMTEDLEKKMQLAIDKDPELWCAHAVGNVIDTADSPSRKKSRSGLQQVVAQNFINTDIIIGSTEQDESTLVARLGTVLSESYKEEKESKEREQSSSLKNVSIPECFEEASCSGRIL